MSKINQLNELVYSLGHHVGHSDSATAPLQGANAASGWRHETQHAPVPRRKLDQWVGGLPDLEGSGWSNPWYLDGTPFYSWRMGCLFPQIYPIMVRKFIYIYIYSHRQNYGKKNVSIYRRRLSMIEKLRTFFFSIIIVSIIIIFP